ncbi:unnamed protein product [Ectocarpus fasciculatus]
MSDEQPEPWEPLTMADFLILGMVGTCQAFALGVCIHLIRWRKWPPYVTKNVDIVIIMTFAGFAWTFATAASSGLFQRSKGDFLANCYFEVSISWTTLLVHLMSFVVRVYRMWRILIKHDENMWRAEFQVLLLSTIGLIPLLLAILDPGLYFFDRTANSCSTSKGAIRVMLAMDALGLTAISCLWLVCGRQLRWVRKQFNEYEAMKWTLSCLTFFLFSYAAVVAIVPNGYHVYVRRVTIVYPVLTTYTLLWGSIGEPLKMKLAGNAEYLYSFTQGFSEMPSPAQLKANLAEQLSVQQLRAEFRRYIETKVAQELVDFYLDSLDREEVNGYFPRQAVTMRIVDQYIREGAPDQVNISGECRDMILSTDVTAYDIFDRARAEVLEVMETNFQKDFVETEGFRRIVDASEMEQRQIRLLRAEGFLLPTTVTSPINTEVLSPSSPDGELGPLRRLHLVGRMLFSSSVGPADTLRSTAAPQNAGTGGGEGGKGLGNTGSGSTQGEEGRQDEDGDLGVVETDGGNGPGDGGERGGAS